LRANPVRVGIVIASSLEGHRPPEMDDGGGVNFAHRVG
jgi:hypothetical protein